MQLVRTREIAFKISLIMNFYFSGIDSVRLVYFDNSIVTVLIQRKKEDPKNAPVEKSLTLKMTQEEIASMAIESYGIQSIDDSWIVKDIKINSDKETIIINFTKIQNIDMELRKSLFTTKIDLF